MSCMSENVDVLRSADATIGRARTSLADDDEAKAVGLSAGA